MFSFQTVSHQCEDVSRFLYTWQIGLLLFPEGCREKWTFPLLLLRGRFSWLILPGHWSHLESRRDPTPLLLQTGTVTIAVTDDTWITFVGMNMPSVCRHTWVFWRSLLQPRLVENISSKGHINHILYASRNTHIYCTHTQYYFKVGITVTFPMYSTPLPLFERSFNSMPFTADGITQTLCGSQCNQHI